MEPDPGRQIPETADDFNARAAGTLPGLIGLQIVDVSAGKVEARLPLRGDHLAPNGYLHAATVIALADTSCGYGALANRADGAIGFTTIEIKTNFLGTAREGAIACVARLVHGGRMTQVWDAEVVDESNGKPIALFRCTQMMLYPR
jgi:1,4-dihydroxy-2-naphthoyl-CoA hydrolase